MTAVERAGQLMLTKRAELPELARETANRLCRRVGGCGEVMVTAFAWYAQVCEKLLCTDSLYRVDESAPEVVWLRSLACNMPPQPGDEKPVNESGITWGELFGRATL